MSNKRFEELLDAYAMTVRTWDGYDGPHVTHAFGGRDTRSALIAYFEERTRGIRVTAIRDDAGYWIADQNDTQPENATLILDEVPR
jgi:hypothetical protein